MTRARIAHITTVDGTLRFILLGQLRRLRDEGFEVSAISAPGPYRKDLERARVRHIPWNNATRTWDPKADIRAFVELLAILRRERFDLVHTHTPKAGVMGRIAGRLAGVPVVVSSIHGFYALPEDPATKRIPVLALERIAALFSDVELYVSAEDLRWARRMRLVRGAKGRFLGNGVDVQRFDPSAVPGERLGQLRRRLGIEEGTLVVGAVGRLVVEKGFREFFAAARDIRRSLPKTRFIVLGASDTQKNDAIGTAEIERAREDVIFTGWVDDVRDFLALMDVFVLPSWREGQPVSVIEAAAMAKPLVVTDIRGCREVVRDGVEGLLVPPRDGEQLEQAIIHLLRDRNLREQLGEAARRRAVEHFDETKIAEKLLALYRTLLASKSFRSRPSQVTGDSAQETAVT